MLKYNDLLYSEDFIRANNEKPAILREFYKGCYINYAIISAYDRWLKLHPGKRCGIALWLFEINEDSPYKNDKIYIHNKAEESKNWRSDVSSISSDVSEFSGIIEYRDIRAKPMNNKEMSLVKNGKNKKKIITTTPGAKTSSKTVIDDKIIRIKQSLQMPPLICKTEENPVDLIGLKELNDELKTRAVNEELSKKLLDDKSEVINENLTGFNLKNDLDIENKLKLNHKNPKQDKINIEKGEDLQDSKLLSQIIGKLGTTKDMVLNNIDSLYDQIKHAKNALVVSVNQIKKIRDEDEEFKIKLMKIHEVDAQDKISQLEQIASLKGQVCELKRQVQICKIELERENKQISQINKAQCDVINIMENLSIYHQEKDFKENIITLIESKMSQDDTLSEIRKINIKAHRKIRKVYNYFKKT